MGTNLDTSALTAPLSTNPPARAATEPAPNVPLLDIPLENEPLLQELTAKASEVIQSGRFVLGQYVAEFEQSMAELCQVEHAIGCASGSDALLLALMAADVQAGDEVILPSFTFFATASAVWRLGAKPVFADVHLDSFNLDMNQVADLINERTKAIIPVHLFGQPSDMIAACQLGSQHNICVIEDAAQAIGASLARRAAGAWGDMGCFSFYPTKNLGGFGDGGLLTTNDDSLASQLRLLRGHGMQPRYYHQVVGINSRLDGIQAALLGVKLGHLHRFTRGRQENAQRYFELFQQHDLEQQVVLPRVQADCEHVWNQFTIRVPHDRDALRSYLSERNIGTEIYYPVPQHLQECFSSLDYNRGDLPRTEAAAQQVLSLPIHAGLTVTQQETVVQAMADFFAAR